ncbi:hypothetical protein Dpoa2040_001343 [Dickeya sp. CFBP 2040]|uniref:hypothetical protein n=1 Tax=Dickeya sp. CFBP 2040 TaxID=2718531 RepID=UPI0014483806|nr:hypothetical protein [Dickeya sp. CFBP 2040]NKI74110.1 hypothetical protein [Dickeya sp. CFBP 2040]
MPFSPLFIKPVHSCDRNPTFSAGKVNKNKRKGIETSVVIDLNILSKMNDIIQGKISYNDSQLHYVVKQFNKASLCLSPGFSFSEVDRSYYKELQNSFELFLKIYCPSYIDSPNSVALPSDKDYDRSFKELPLGEKYLHSISYLSMLLIQTITIKYNHLTPEQKFTKYVEYMISNADILTAIEAEIAKYCFYDSSNCKDIAFKQFCKTIRSNFCKGGKKEYIIKNALNSASDIIYYRVVAIQSNEKLDGVVQDTWLLTADEGLKSIALSIYFVPSFDGCDYKAVKLVRNGLQKESTYWNYCDDLFQYYNLRRNFITSESLTTQEIESKFTHIINCSSALEDGFIT